MCNFPKTLKTHSYCCIFLILINLLKNEFIKIDLFLKSGPFIFFLF